MAFKEIIIDRAWERAGGQCECESSACEHKGRCTMTLYGLNRGKDKLMGWEAFHKKPLSEGGDDSLNNCILLCHACYEHWI